MDLNKAIQIEYLDAIKTRLLSKEFTTDKNWHDYDALNIALKCGRKDAVQVLLQNNCRVNKPTKIFTDTPLHNAVRLADPELVLDLLEKKAIIAVQNADGDSPLHLAFLLKRDKLIDILLDFIEKNMDFLNLKNSQGLTHLHIACTSSNTTAIEGFLNNGALVEDSISNDSILWAGYNCFHFAVEFRSMTALKVLLRQDASQTSLACSQPNSLGKTPLQLINQQLEDLSIMASLMTPKGPSPFHLACAGDDSKLLQSFLNNGVDPNDRSLVNHKFCTAYSPLHFATKSDNCENIEILLKHGASTYNRNEEDMTPVQSALYCPTPVSNEPVIRILYDATDNKFYQRPDKNGLSFAHVACSMNDLVAVEQFLSKGMDVNSKVTYERQQLYNYTLLHFAIKYQHLEIVKYLVECDADVNCCEDCVDGTPLHLACKIGNQAIIDYLLDNGANVEAVRACDKKTPLHQLLDYCLEQKLNNNLMTYFEKFVKLGADVNARDVEGDTVLHIACSQICNGMFYIKLLLDCGADINIENNTGLTAFDCQLENLYAVNLTQLGDYTILYHHVQKLKAIGLQVNPKNEECCRRLFEEIRFTYDLNVADFEEGELARKQQERTVEIAKMKNIKFADAVSVYDFVKMEPRQAKNFVAHDTLVEVVLKEIPLFGYLVRLQHRKAIKEKANRAAAKRRRTK